MADKPVKQHVVSFRVPEEQATTVKKMLAAQPIMGVKSVNQYFRKIGRDFLAGKLTYKNPQDAYVDTDIVG